MQIEGWELKKLEELCPVDAPITYGVLKPGEYVKGGIPLLQIKDLADGKILTGDLHLISDKLDNEYKRSRIVKNDILISLVGTVGRIAKYESSNPANIHRNIGRIRTNNHEYIFYFLHSEIASKIISGVSSGSSQSALNLSTLRAMEIPLPPLDEQKKIAEILSTWDKAIEAVEKLVANSQLQKKALMQQLLTGQKRLLDENGVKFGGEWKEVLLGEIAKITTGSSNRQDSILDGEYTFFDRSEDIRTSNIYLFDCEAIIVGGEGQDFIPKYFEGKFDLHQRTYAIMDFQNYDGKFLYYMIYHFRNYFLSQAVGSTVKSLRLPMFQKMSLKVPSIKEQEKIAQVLTLADREIELYQQQLDKLKLEKKALMQQLLTGQKRVKVVA